MAMAATSIRKRWNWRRIVFSILAALFGLQSLAVGLLILAPSPWLTNALTSFSFVHARSRRLLRDCLRRSGQV